MVLQNHFAMNKVTLEIYNDWKFVDKSRELLNQLNNE